MDKKKRLSTVILLLVSLYFVNAFISSHVISSPSDGFWTNDDQPDFTFTTISHINDTLECELFVDNVSYGTDLTVSNDTSTSITANPALNDGTYSWYINCTDANATNMSAVRTITIDTENPTFNSLNSPENNSIFTDSNVFFNFSAYDNLDPVLNYTLILNSENNATGYTINNSGTEFFQNLADGTYDWNIQVVDNATNSVTYSEDYHFTVSSSGVVSLSKSVGSSIDCTETCTIYFNITNNNYTLSQTLHDIEINNTDSNDRVQEYYIYRYDGAYTFNSTNSTAYSNHNLSFYESASDVDKYKIIVNKSHNRATDWTMTYKIDAETTLQFTTTLTCVEDWSCDDWSNEDDECGERECDDANSCGTFVDKPEEEEDCDDGSSSSSSSSTPESTTPATTETTTVITYGLVEPDDEIDYNPNSLEIPFTSIKFKMKVSKQVLKITVISHDTKPSSMEEMANAYKYMEINPEYFGDSDVNGNIVLQFKVPKTWVNANANDKEEIYLYKFKNDKWTKLTTTYEGIDGDDYEYEANMTGFSKFVIAGEPVEVEIEEEEETNETVVNETIVEESVLDEDPDNDGLTTQEEEALGTNPLMADSDGDGYTDAIEVEQGTDPMDSFSFPKERNLSWFWFTLLMIALLGGAGYLVYRFRPWERMKKKEKSLEEVRAELEKHREENEDLMKDHELRIEHNMKELRAYVKDAHKEGYTYDEIKESLLGAGWPDNLVEEEFKHHKTKDVKKDNITTKEPEKIEKVKEPAKIEKKSKPHTKPKKKSKGKKKKK